MINIAIFGSCVTRDAFSELNSGASPGFNLTDYYARSSFASLSFKPYIGGGDLNFIESKFQQRMINRDAGKRFWSFIENYKGFLVIDFTDDRFPLIELLDGSALTLSAELRKVRKSIPGFFHAKAIDPFSLQYFERWEEGWGMFADLMKKKENLGNVIINKVFWATTDDRGIELPDQSLIAEANEHHQRVYEACARDLPDSQFITYPENLFVAAADHKWGRAPFHFCNDLYSRFLDNLKLIATTE